MTFGVRVAIELAVAFDKPIVGLANKGLLM